MLSLLVVVIVVFAVFVALFLRLMNKYEREMENLEVDNSNRRDVINILYEDIQNMNIDRTTKEEVLKSLRNTILSLRPEIQVITFEHPFQGKLGWYCLKCGSIVEDGDECGCMEEES